MDTVKVLEIHRPKVTVKRGDTMETSSHMQVWFDDFLWVTIHYNYAYCDNATQHSLAEALAKMYENGDE